MRTFINIHRTNRTYRDLGTLVLERDATYEMFCYHNEWGFLIAGAKYGDHPTDVIHFKVEARKWLGHSTRGTLSQAIFNALLSEDLIDV